jgi:penicillin-binding protein 1B
LPVRIRLTQKPAAERKNPSKAPAASLFKRFPVLKFLIAGLTAVLVVGIVFASLLYSKYARLADQKLEQGPFPDTSLLYSAPEVVGPGDPATPVRLAEQLRESGYAEDPHSSVMGWFHLEEPDVLEIHPGPKSVTEEEPARFRFQDGKIASIVSLKDGKQLDQYTLEPKLLSSLYDKNREMRRLVRFEDIPPVLVDAVLSAEDKHFFHHSGFDFVRIAKVAWIDLRERRRAEGASTITQQLARMLWLDNQKTFSRKFAEALITIHLERKLTKEKIFEYYANDYPLGRRGPFTIRGFGEASQAFFGKSIRQLTLPEAATLAGLIQEPSYRNPIRHPDRAKARRNVVLKRMLDNGYISEAQYRSAIEAPLQIAKQGVESADAPYFVDIVNERLGDEFPDDDFQTDGAKIYTTIDPELQQDAVRAVADGMQKVDAVLEKRHKPGTPVERPQVALIALDPHTGEVKALIGGRNYDESQLNHALVERPSGSAFKPFVYAAALNTALTSQTPITPSTLYSDEPKTFYFDGKVYEPVDYHHSEWLGNVTLREAFAKSLNVPAVEVAESVGYDKVAELAHEAGLDNVQPTPAEALGAYNVTPLEIARAYTIFANDGEEVEPRFISRIVDKNGVQMWASQPDTKEVLDPRINYLVVSLMEEVLRSGTGAGVRSYGFTLPAAGKTGTSHDAWFAGFTTKLLCVVWVGLDNYHDIKMDGAHAALPIWAEFMKLAHTHAAYRDVTEFQPPPGVVSAQVDPQSGYLATSGCPDARTEYYLLGTQPTQFCPLHHGSPTEVAGWEANPAPSAPMPAPASAAGMAQVPPVVSPLPPQPGMNAENQPPQPPPKKKKGFFDKLKSIFK